MVQLENVGFNIVPTAQNPPQNVFTEQTPNAPLLGRVQGNHTRRKRLVYGRKCKGHQYEEDYITEFHCAAAPEFEEVYERKDVHYYISKAECQKVSNRGEKTCNTVFEPMEPELSNVLVKTLE